MDKIRFHNERKTLLGARIALLEMRSALPVWAVFKRRKIRRLVANEVLMMRFIEAAPNSFSTPSTSTIQRHSGSIRTRLRRSGIQSDTPLVDGILRLLQWFVDNADAVFEIIDRLFK